jgi:hypothetical protein
MYAPPSATRRAAPPMDFRLAAREGPVGAVVLLAADVLPTPATSMQMIISRNSYDSYLSQLYIVLIR